MLCWRPSCRRLLLKRLCGKHRRRPRPPLAAVKRPPLLPVDRHSVLVGVVSKRASSNVNNMRSRPIGAVVRATALIAPCSNHARSTRATSSTTVGTESTSPSLYILIIYNESKASKNANRPKVLSSRH